MSYVTHYAQADQTITHLATVVSGIDPLLRSQYTGFAAMCAVTVYELAIKEVFCDFARKKHKGYGHFVDSFFNRINGRIALRDLKQEYLPRFGDKYLQKFTRLLDTQEAGWLRANSTSIKSSYGNLIIWRHEFAHEGRVPTNATFAEVQRSYDRGKLVIECLANALVR